MKTRTVAIIAVAAGALAMFLMDRIPLAVHGSEKMPVSIAAVPGTVGTQDVTGPYEVVEHWPKPLSNLPGHENWTWGATEGVFAESPNRIFIAQMEELPVVKRPQTFALPNVGPSISFPIVGLPIRSGGGSSWKGEWGVDHRFEHGIVVVDSDGNIVEQWTQWDKLLKQPHAVFINPYDSDKNVWVVDDGLSQIFKFSNDGKRLLQTIGIANEMGSDEKHFGSPTFLAWLPDSTMFVADGYVNSRVVKFDKDGKYLTAWGQKGNPPSDVRPGYFNTVHGIAVDPATRQVYVNDQDNHRIQIFDEDGRFLDQRPLDPLSRTTFLYISANGRLWVGDSKTSKIIEYDLKGHYLYSWGTFGGFGDFSGAIWGPHSFSVDQDGNLYVACNFATRVQKFRPRKGANPNFLVGQPPRGTWK